jgi:uncharacterized protein
MEIQREEKGHRGAFYIDGDQGRLASLTFSGGPDGKIVMLDHTEVSDALRGQGVARKLVEAAVMWARGSGVKLVAVCPFAKAVFERAPELRDVLA